MSGTNLKYPYVLEEDKKILNYVIENCMNMSIRGRTLWQVMEREEICPGRTWQSLKNRYLRNIALDLARPEYKLSKDDIVKIKASSGAL